MPYDENLEENHFFVDIQTKFNNYFTEVCRKKYYILVPRKDTIENVDFTETVVRRHILVPDETRTNFYYNLLGEEISACGLQLTLFSSSTHEACCQTNILFEETYITENVKQSCRLLCINRMLDVDGFHNDSCTVSLSPDDSDIADVNKCVENGSRFLIEGYDYYAKLLFNDDIQNFVKNHLFKRLNAFSCQLEKDYTPSWLIGHLKNLAESEFTSCFNYVLMQKKKHKQKRLDDKDVFCLKLAAEIYFFQTVYIQFFPVLFSCLRDEEAHLNTNRHIAEVLSPTDLGVSAHLLDTLPLAKRELSRLNDNHTPYGKLLCLRKCIEILASGPSLLNGSWTNLSSDDMLPALVFLVIKLKHINNWISNMAFVSDFHFSKFPDDELAYCLASFEASIQYLKSGSLSVVAFEKYCSTKSLSNKDIPETMDNDSAPLRLVYQKLLDNIKSGNVKTLELMYQHQSVDYLSESNGSAGEENVSEDLLDASNCGPLLCHPLCKCHSCSSVLAAANLRTFNVNSKFVHGLSSLHLASLFEKTAVLNMLLKKLRANVSCRDDFDRTPLHLTCTSGSQACTLLLLDNGASRTVVDNRGFTPLHTAVYYGHVDCVKALVYFVDKKSDVCTTNLLDINAVDHFGESPLILAVKYAYAEIVQVLLDNGASQRVANKQRKFAKNFSESLYVSNLLSGDDPTVEFIIVDKIAILSTKNNGSTSPRKEEGKRFCNEEEEKVNKLLTAVADNDLPLVKFYLGSVDDYEAKLQMCHPLCQCDRCTTAVEAVESYLNPDCIGADGLSPLHIASKYGYLDLVDYLVRCGANLNLNSSRITHCQTAAHFAAAYGCTDIIARLIDCGADVNGEDTNQNTPLHYASMNGHVETVDFLLRCETNINRKNRNGDTPLHLAVKYERLDVVKVLLGHGANPVVPNAVRLSPADFATSEEAERLLSSPVVSQRKNINL